MGTALVVKTPFLEYITGSEITDLGEIQFITSTPDYFQFYVVIGDPFPVFGGPDGPIRLLGTKGLVSPDNTTTNITSDNVLHAMAGGSLITINGVTKTVAEWLAYLLAGNVIAPPSTTNHILNRTPGEIIMRDGSILSHRASVLSTTTNHILNRSSGLITMRNGWILSHRTSPTVSTTTDHILNRSSGLITMRNGSILSHRTAPTVSTTSNHILNRSGGLITMRNGTILSHGAIANGSILNRTGGHINMRDSSVLAHG